MQRYVRIKPTEEEARKRREEYENGVTTIDSSKCELILYESSPNVMYDAMLDMVITKANEDGHNIKRNEKEVAKKHEQIRKETLEKYFSEDSGYEIYEDHDV